MLLQPSKTYRGVRVTTNPARGDVMARDEPKCAKGSSMVSAFVTQIPAVTMHVLHGEPQPVLSTDHRLLTCVRQLHMCAGLGSCPDKYQQHA